VQSGLNRRVLVIGDEAWPVPIPIVRAGDQWRFATEEGKDEIVRQGRDCQSPHRWHVELNGAEPYQPRSAQRAPRKIWFLDASG